MAFLFSELGELMELFSHLAIWVLGTVGYVVFRVHVGRFRGEVWSVSPRFVCPGLKSGHHKLETLTRPKQDTQSNKLPTAS